MEITNRDIKFSGRIVTTASNNKLASAEQIYDYDLKMNQSEINKLRNADEIKIEIFSTNGLILGRDIQSTYVCCNILKNGESINAEYIEKGGIFKWTRISRNSDSDASWNSDSLHSNDRTGQIQVTKDDISNQTIFKCEINKELLS